VSVGDGWNVGQGELVYVMWQFEMIGTQCVANICRDHSLWRLYFQYLGARALPACTYANNDGSDSSLEMAFLFVDFCGCCCWCILIGSGVIRFHVSQELPRRQTMVMIRSFWASSTFADRLAS
jgi:hypothetical protein